jgi:hypothetical protein
LKININEWFRGKRAVCVLVILFTAMACALTYAITLGMRQQATLIELNKSADRIIKAIAVMEAEQALKEKEKADVIKLEDKTAEEMKIDE